MMTEKYYTHCNNCGNEKWHSESIPFVDSSTWHHEDGSTIEFSKTSVMLQCQVCKNTKLRVSKWNSENGEDGEQFFPPNTIRKMPDWVNDLPPEYRDLARQIYPALNAESLGLALMGIRALLDVYISRHSTEKNDFSKKIEELVTTRVLNTRQAATLSTTFDAGSAAAHRGFIPSEINVITALDVVENLIRQDILTAISQILKSETPPDLRRAR
jgi:hypothetical protein